MKYRQSKRLVCQPCGFWASVVVPFLSLVVACGTPAAGNGDSDESGGAGGDVAGSGGQSDEGGNNGEGGEGGQGSEGGNGETDDAGAGEDLDREDANVTPQDSGAGGTGGTGGAGGMGGTLVPINCAGGHPFCDSFEEYETGASPQRMDDNAKWRIASSPQLGVVDSTRAFSGKKSVKFSIPKGGSVNASLGTIHKGVFPATKLNARMMVWLDAKPQGASPFHWSFMRTLGRFEDPKIPRSTASFGLGGWRDGMQSTMNSATLDCWNHARQQIPTGKWVCVEWELNSATHEQKVLVDGQVAARLSFKTQPNGDASRGCIGGNGGTPWYVPTLFNFTVGWQHFHTMDAPRTLWIDDVVLSKSPIGCPAR